MTKMNVQLVDSLIQAILSLSADEQLAIAEKIFANIPYPWKEGTCAARSKGRMFEIFA